jgi:hypothetical protein
VPGNRSSITQEGSRRNRCYGTLSFERARLQPCRKPPAYEGYRLQPVHRAPKPARALQAAEKLASSAQSAGSVKGHGFSRAENHLIKTWASAPATLPQPVHQTPKSTCLAQRERIHSQTTKIIGRGKKCQGTTLVVPQTPLKTRGLQPLRECEDEKDNFAPTLRR